MSGVGFSSSVLDNINKASLFRLGFTILLLGVVLSNVIYILLKYVWLLSKRNYGETKTPKTGQLWLNLVLSLLLAALLAAYGFGLDKIIARYRQDNFSTAALSLPLCQMLNLNPMKQGFIYGRITNNKSSLSGTDQYGGQDRKIRPPHRKALRRIEVLFSHPFFKKWKGVDVKLCVQKVSPRPV